MLAVDIVSCNKELSTVLEMLYQICELLQSYIKERYNQPTTKTKSKMYYQKTLL